MEVCVILKSKVLSVLMICLVVLSFSVPVNAETKEERFARYESMWNNATDSERYFMETEVKAHMVGLSTGDFTFFAKVIEGEGQDSEEDITDKVLIACTVLNRVNCKKWPTRSVITTLKRPGQFEVVDRETGECKCARSLDAEWAIVLAYRIVAVDGIDCHMVYYNSIGFTGYSRAMTNYAFFGGNYFSCIPCDCEYCSEHFPNWKEEDVEMYDELIYRPEGVEAHYF